MTKTIDIIPKLWYNCPLKREESTKCVKISSTSSAADLGVPSWVLREIAASIDPDDLEPNWDELNAWEGVDAEWEIARILLGA